MNCSFQGALAIRVTVFALISAHWLTVEAQEALPRVTVEGECTGCDSFSDPLGRSLMLGDLLMSNTMDTDSGGEVAIAKRPRKTAEQKRREREKCESDRNDARFEATTIYQAQMGVCASGNSTSYGYFIDQWKKFTGEVLTIGRGSCSVELTRNYNALLNVIDRRRDRCVAAVG